MLRTHGEHASSARSIRCPGGCGLCTCWLMTEEAGVCYVILGRSSLLWCLRRIWSAPLLFSLPMTSKSLIPVDNSTLQCEDGTLLRHGVVGMTIAQIMHEGGKVVTEVLDAGYCGPHDPKNCIQEFFSEAEKRERALDQLYETNRGHDLRTKAHQQLLKHCQDLLKYARPECVLQVICP